jgi:hypothetical protein
MTRCHRPDIRGDDQGEGDRMKKTPLDPRRKKLIDARAA